MRLYYHLRLLYLRLYTYFRLCLLKALLSLCSIDLRLLSGLCAPIYVSVNYKQS